MPEGTEWQVCLLLPVPWQIPSTMLTQNMHTVRGSGQSSHNHAFLATLLQSQDIADTVDSSLVDLALCFSAMGSARYIASGHQNMQNE